MRTQSVKKTRTLYGQRQEKRIKCELGFRRLCKGNSQWNFRTACFQLQSTRWRNIWWFLNRYQDPKQILQLLWYMSQWPYQRLHHSRSQQWPIQEKINIWGQTRSEDRRKYLQEPWKSHIEGAATMKEKESGEVNALNFRKPDRNHPRNQRSTFDQHRGNEPSTQNIQKRLCKFCFQRHKWRRDFCPAWNKKCNKC